MFVFSLGKIEMTKKETSVFYRSYFFVLIDFTVSVINPQHLNTALPPSIFPSPEKTLFGIYNRARVVRLDCGRETNY